MSYTSSSVGTAMSCLRKYKYKYMDLYREADVATAALAGSVVHVGLECFWNWLPLEKSIEMMRRKTTGGPEFDVETNKPGFDQIGTLEFWESEAGRIAFLRCEAMVIGYYNHYSLESLVEARTEQEFEFEMGGHTFKGKWDVFYFSANKRPVVMDHKTTSVSIETTTGVFFERLPMDVQRTIYVEAAWRLHGRSGPLPAFIYDIIGSTKSAPKQKKKIAKRKSESDEEYAIRKDENQESIAEFGARVREYYLTHPEKYLRYSVPCTEDQHEARLKEILLFVGILNTGKLHNLELFDIRNSSACFNYGGCSYMDVCLGRDSLESSTKLIQIDSKHPELDDKDVLKLPGDKT